MVEGCTALIAAGSMVQGPNEDYDWAILCKNSDTSNSPAEIGIHVAAKAAYDITYADDHVGGTATTSFNTYAYTGARSYKIGDLPDGPAGLYRVNWGMNERGLAACHTALGVYVGMSGIYGTAEWAAEVAAGYPNTAGLEHRGRDLVTLILALYDDIDDVLADIVDPTKVIGPENRFGGDSILIVDKTGDAVVIEYSMKKAIWYKVTDGYWSEDNVNRIWEPYYAAVGAYGGAIPDILSVVGEDDSGNRTAYITNIFHELKNANNGKVSYRDAVQQLVRYINHREDSSSTFDVDISDYWEISNDGTYSSMVAVTGDTRYDGRLNTLWGTYGNPPFLGVYLPSNAYAGALPDNGAGTWSGYAPYTDMNDYLATYVAPAAGGMGTYNPTTVAAYQGYAFTVENYSFQQWENLLRTIPDATLTDGEVEDLLNDFIDDCQVNGVSVWKEAIEGTPIVNVSYETVDPLARLGIPVSRDPYDTSPYYKVESWSTIPVTSNTNLTLHLPDTIDVDTATQCTLTVNVVGPVAGGQACSVTLLPAGGTYPAGTTVTLTPAAGSFYRFHSWKGDLTGASSPETIVMSGDKTVTANFEYVVQPLAAKIAFGFPDETNGIYVTSAWPTGGTGLDGNSILASKNPYKTPYFFHGDLLADYPVLRTDDDDLTIENCIVDDGGNFPLKPIPANVAVVVSADGCSIKNCTLNNCVRYGIGTQSATNFYIGYNTVNKAQYCISGSDSTNDVGIVEHNNLRGASNECIKMRGWTNVIVRHNFMDVTPIWGAPSKIGIAFSGNTPYTADCTVEHNVIIKLNTGTGLGTYGVVADPYGIGGTNTRNIFQYNILYNLYRTGNLQGNTVGHGGTPPDIDYHVRYNTFVNCTYDTVLDSGVNNSVHDNTII